MGDKSRGDAKLQKFRSGASDGKSVRGNGTTEERDLFFAQYANPWSPSNAQGRLC